MSDHSSTPTGVIHEVRWSEIFPWLILVKALRVALLLRVLLIAALGVVLTQAGWLLVSHWFSPELSPPTFLREQLLTSDTQQQLGQILSATSPDGWQSSTLVSGWYWLTQPFLQLGSSELTGKVWLGTALFGLWAIVVWTFLGGVLCRITSIYLTRGELLGPLRAVRETGSVCLDTLGGPMIILLAVLALAVPLMLLGALLRIDLVAPLVAVLWCFVLAWGLMLAVILIGLALGWPLIWACLSVERSDAFDGVSRCYAYVYQRPFHFGFFVLVAALLGIVGDVVVQVFVSASVSLCEWTVSWGLGSDNAVRLFSADLETASPTLATKLIFYWKWSLNLIRASFPVACLWPMSVGIYLLLRRQVDATEMDEITLADGTVQAGLPMQATTESAQKHADSSEHKDA